IGFDFGMYLLGWLLPTFPLLLIASRRKISPEPARIHAFFPFDDESQWLASKPLLERLNIPSFDAVRREREPPIRRSWLVGIPIAIAGYAIEIPLLAAAITAVIVVFAIIFPIFGIWRAFGPRHRETHD